MRARTLVEWKIEDANTIDEGTGYFTTLQKDDPVGGFVEFSGTIQVVNEPTYEVITTGAGGDYPLRRSLHRR